MNRAKERNTVTTCELSQHSAEPALQGKCTRPATGAVFNINTGVEIPSCETCSKRLSPVMLMQGWKYEADVEEVEEENAPGIPWPDPQPTLIEAAGWKGFESTPFIDGLGPHHSTDLATEDEHLRAAIKQHVTEQALADMISDRDYLSLAEFCRDNLWTSIRVARIAALHLAAAEVDPFLAALSNAVHAQPPKAQVI